MSTPLPEYMHDVNSSLVQNQHRNRECCINGMLLSHKNFYLQIIEGDRTTVNNLYNKIVCDPRHENVSLLRYQEVTRPQFTEWYYAIVDKSLDYEFYEYIADLIDVDSEFNKDLTSAAAMGLLRRATAIVLSKSIPNRRITDVKQIPTL